MFSSLWRLSDYGCLLNLLLVLRLLGLIELLLLGMLHELIKLRSASLLLLLSEESRIAICWR